MRRPRRLAPPTRRDRGWTDDAELEARDHELQVYRRQGAYHGVVFCQQITAKQIKVLLELFRPAVDACLASAPR